MLREINIVARHLFIVVEIMIHEFFPFRIKMHGIRKSLVVNLIQIVFNSKNDNVALLEIVLYVIQNEIKPKVAVKPHVYDVNAEFIMNFF